MVAKLTKHELRSYWKTFLPLWGAMLVLAVINGFTLRTMQDVEGAMGFLTHVVPLLVLFGMLVATCVLTLVLVLQRFYRGLLGSEGYLAFTLPVSRRQLIASKLIASLVVEFLSVLVVCLTFLLLGLVLTEADIFAGFGELFAVMEKFFAEMPHESWMTVLLCAEGLVLAVVGAALGTLHFYAAMSLGHLSGKYRMPLSVVAYVGLSIAGSWVMTLLGQMGIKSDLFRHLEVLMDASSVLKSMALGMGVVILLDLAGAVILWAVTEYILEKKLNLE